MNTTLTTEQQLAQLRAAQIAYASEFPLNVDGEPDVENIHENIRKLKRELAGYKFAYNCLYNSTTQLHD